MTQDLGKFLKGCHKIFVDTGANRGTHIRKLFEPEKYPRSRYLVKHASLFGEGGSRSKPSSVTGICAVGLEPNPRWASTHREIEKAYALQGWKVKFLPVAAGDHGGVLSFHTTAEDAVNSDWGFSEFESKAAEQGKSKDIVKQVKVEVFSDLIAKINASSPSGIRLIKMDIEGSEYAVIPDLLKKKLLCEDTIKHMTIEWHHRKTSLTQGEVMEIEKLAHHHTCEASKATLVEDFDDESYLYDGVPLPAPNSSA